MPVVRAAPGSPPPQLPAPAQSITLCTLSRAEGQAPCRPQHTAHTRQTTNSRTARRKLHQPWQQQLGRHTHRPTCHSRQPHLAQDVHAVSEGRGGGKRPAGATVLGNVLIARYAHVGRAVDAAPAAGQGWGGRQRDNRGGRGQSQRVPSNSASAESFWCGGAPGLDTKVSGRLVLAPMQDESGPRACVWLTSPTRLAGLTRPGHTGAGGAQCCSGSSGVRGTDRCQEAAGLGWLVHTTAGHNSTAGAQLVATAVAPLRSTTTHSSSW
jgi:hypothetical protein